MDDSALGAGWGNDRAPADLEETDAMPHRLWTLLVAAFISFAALSASAADARAAKPFGAPGTLDGARFRALIIWVQDYSQWTPLRAPKKDAERIATALSEHYLFEPGDVEVIGNPTLAELFRALKGAAVKAGPKDSLLIFFAGHGYLERETGDGYWIPKDGKPPGDAAELSYLSSTWVRNVLKRSKARHVVVMSDSCFSGALLGSRGGRTLTDRYYRTVFGKRSFEALTSGALETVNDTGAPGGHSPFAYYVAQALEKPSGTVFDTHDVFQRVREGVKQYASQTPLFGRLNGAPSDGGAFVFVSRKAASGTRAEPTRPGATATPVTPAAASPTAEPAARAVRKAWEQVDQTFRAERFDDALRDGLRAGFCEAGHARGCHLMGELYALGLGTVASPARARDYYARAATLAVAGCDANDEHSCHILGLAHTDGYGGEADVDTAFRYFQRACDLGHAGACHALATQVLDGAGTAADPPKAVELFTKACRAGEALGCFDAAEMLRTGAGVRKRLSRAAQLFKSACEGGMLKGCGKLGAMHIGGRGVKKDVKGGARYIVRGCEGGDPFSCTQVGVLYQRGIGIKRGKKLPKKAASVWQRVCEADDADASSAGACSLLGEAYEKGRGVRANVTKADRYYRTACERGSAHSCELLAERLSTGERGWPQRPEDAMALYRRACEQGSGRACRAAKKLNLVRDESDAADDPDWDEIGGIE